MSKFQIDEHGFWISNGSEGHMYDIRLCFQIIDYLKGEGINSLIDLGCGTGEYVHLIDKQGIRVEGMDGNPYTKEIASQPHLCNVVDLTEPLDLIETYSYVMSLEVGEHIPQDYEKVFLDNIANNCVDGAIISWQVEGQGGDGHVNCRSNEYIIGKMKERNLFIDWEATYGLRQKQMLNWFKNTLMVFRKKKQVRLISPYRIKYMVCSCHKYREKRESCRKTWFNTIPKGSSQSFFVGGTSSEIEEDVVYLDCPDTYEGLQSKTIQMFNYFDSIKKDFDYLFKCDDDSYVVANRVNNLLANKPQVIGHVHGGNVKYLSGGAGYLIHRDFVSQIAKEMKQGAEYEDVEVTEAQRRLNLEIVHTPLLFPRFEEIPTIQNNRISQHHCDISMQRAIHRGMGYNLKVDVPATHTI